MLRSIEMDLVVARPGRKELLEGEGATFRLERQDDLLCIIAPPAQQGLDDYRVILSVDEVRKLALFFSLWASEIMEDTSFEEEDEEEEEPDVGRN